jgi:hypothetical protein
VGFNEFQNFSSMENRGRDSGGRVHVAQALERRMKLESRGLRCEVNGGWSLPYIEVREHWGEVATRGNDRC